MKEQSLRAKLKAMMDRAGVGGKDIAAARGCSIFQANNMRSRGISSLADLLLVCGLCGYKVYMCNDELNLKIPITPEDIAELEK